MSGHFTISTDKAKVEELYNKLRPYFKVAKEGYRGSYDRASGKMSGQGIYHYINGDVYDGDWIDGERSGKGNYIYANGSSYEGDWLDDKRTGKGVLRFADGNSYEGDFKDDRWNGLGRYCYSYGGYYDGSFVDNLRMGRGIYHYFDGNCYDGDWVQGKMSGQGKYRFSNGNVFEGIFLDDKMTTGKLFLTDLNITVAAIFSGGDLEPQSKSTGSRYKLYHLVLKNVDGSIYWKGDFNNGVLSPLIDP